jgi:hypothetical protein
MCAEHQRKNEGFPLENGGEPFCAQQAKEKPPEGGWNKVRKGFGTFGPGALRLLPERPGV